MGSLIQATESPTLRATDAEAAGAVLASSESLADRGGWSVLQWSGEGRQVGSLMESRVPLLRPRRRWLGHAASKVPHGPPIGPGRTHHARAKVVVTCRSHGQNS